MWIGGVLTLACRVLSFLGGGRAGLPNFVNKLQEAAGRVARLSGPEPALLRRLREQLRPNNRNDTMLVVEQVESLLVQMEQPSQQSTSRENDASASRRDDCDGNREATASTASTAAVPVVVTSCDSVSQNVGSSSSSSSPSSSLKNAAVSSRVGLSSAPVPAAPVTTTSACTDSTAQQQFLISPVYA